MEKYELHYADISLGLEADVLCYKYDTFKELIGACRCRIKETLEIVYLLTYQIDFQDKINPCPKFPETEIFVSSSPSALNLHLDNIKKNLFYNKRIAINKIFLQEYNSYEDAYQVAIMMKETSPLCYRKTKVN
jgi:hypothetical protein